MGVDEWQRWIQYFNEEPFGATRENAHAGIIAATIVNTARACFGGKGKESQFKDFMLKPRATAEEVTEGFISLFKTMATPTEKQKRRADKRAAGARKRKGSNGH